jgi:molybdopterin synthase catalytic subunit
MSEKKIKNIFVEGPIDGLFIGKSITSHSRNKNIGGHSIFLGQIRADVIENKTVKAIEYTSHTEMALELMADLREAIFAKYDLICMHVYHSLGIVHSGDISLFVFTSSKHRKEAIKACEEIVEKIKAELPIWGKEIFEDDSYQWKENKSW